MIESNLILYAGHVFQKHIDNMVGYPGCLNLEMVDLSISFLLEAFHICARITAALFDLPDKMRKLNVVRAAGQLSDYFRRGRVYLPLQPSSGIELPSALGTHQLPFQPLLSPASA